MWLEPGHSTVAWQSAHYNQTVNVAVLQLDCASAALEAFDKGTCRTIHKDAMSEIELHVKA
jgi:hypothetical protein